jgi:hypothetical protein
MLPETIIKVTLKLERRDVNLWRGGSKMAKTKSTNSSKPQKRSRPALTPEAKESQMVSLAHDLAEKQLRDGTASSQVITHYLKLGSIREKLERERLEEENRLLKAKTKALDNAEEIKVLYEQALKAMRNYSGQGEPDESEDY